MGMAMFMVRVNVLLVEGVIRVMRYGYGYVYG